MERLNRQKFLKGATAMFLGGLLSTISPFVALSKEVQASQTAQPPLPDDVVVGAIREKWLALGGRQGFGAPITRELPTPDNIGRFNHFAGNRSIYWTPRTGAVSIQGAIRDRWAQLGWERSWLGYPVNDEVNFPEGGRVSSFEHGECYWWPDTGPIDLNEVVVNYTGLQYFTEMDWDQASDSDEPYGIIGVVSPTSTLTKRTKTYSDVDSKESRRDMLELYRGKPRGLTISVLLMEHDEGDQDAYLKEMQVAVDGTFAAVTTLVALIPVVGPVIAVAAGPLLAEVASKVGKILSDLLDLGDDKIGETTLAMTTKEMVVLAARTENTRFREVEFKRETDLIRGGGASAKFAFGIEPA